MGDGEVKNHLRARPHEPKREVVNRAAYGLTSPLQGERGGILQTANNYLAETLSNTRQERTFQRLKPKGFRDGGYLFLKQVLDAFHLSNDDQVVRISTS